MTTWLEFLGSAQNKDLLSMVIKQPRKAPIQFAPYQMPILMHEPGRITAVVIGEVTGDYSSQFIAVDPTGTLAWRTLCTRLLRVVEETSPRCVFIVCGAQAELVTPKISGNHVIVRLCRPEVSTADANALIDAAANL